MRLKSSGTILVVDDESSIVEFMKEALADEGYTVLAEPSGDRAIDIAAAHHPNLILCDLHMPGITGASFVERIHQDSLVDIPVVMMTADIQAARDLSGTNFAACLLKPFDLDELFSCVVKYINTPSHGNGAL